MASLLVSSCTVWGSIGGKPYTDWEAVCKPKETEVCNGEKIKDSYDYGPGIDGFDFGPAPDDG